MGTELEIRQNVFIEKMSANPIDSISQIGDLLHKSGMFGLKTAEQGRTIAMIALCQGKNPFDVIREYHIMGDGKLAMKSDAMLAHFISRGGRVDWKIYSDAEVVGVFTASNGASISIDIKWDDAKRKGWVTKTYEKYPRQMLKARAISEGIRAVDPGCIIGVYTPEEMDAVIVDADVVPIQKREEKQAPPPLEDTSHKVFDFFAKYQISRDAIIGKLGEPPWGDSAIDELNKLKSSMAQQKDAVAKKATAEEFFNISDATVPADEIL